MFEAWVGVGQYITQCGWMAVGTWLSEPISVLPTSDLSHAAVQQQRGQHTHRLQGLRYNGTAAAPDAAAPATVAQAAAEAEAAPAAAAAASTAHNRAAPVTGPLEHMSPAQNFGMT